VTNRLYERSAELAAIDDAVLALERGQGRALLVEALAGRGKSSLVEYAVAAAREAGARSLVVRARHLESAAPYEVLRRLLGPAVEEAGGAESLTGAAAFAAPLFSPGAELAPGVDYGCQWLIAGLAERAPLVLTVDDAHWADAASLRVLLEVQAELSVEPVLLVLASRPVENPDAQRRLATMAAQPGCVVLAPGPLSRQGVAAVVVETLGEPVHDAFVDECLRVTGGNAFYLHELLRPYASDFRRDQQTYVKDGSMSLGRTVSWRLGELGPEATGLAQAAAILGDGCSLHVAAELAAVDDAVAVEAAARLEAASVLAHGDPVEFLHPLIRAAVEETLPAVAVGELHARAARLLRELGALAAEVDQHLVEAPGSGDPEVAAYLAERGRAALDTGSVAIAARLLARALDEPPPSGERADLLISLASAEHALGRLPEAREHLEVAMRSPHRAQRMAAATELFEVHQDAGSYEAVADWHAAAIAMRPFGQTDSEVLLRSQLLTNVLMGSEVGLPDLPREVAGVDADLLPVDRPIERHHLAIASIFERTMQHGTSERLRRNLWRAVDHLPDDVDLMGHWDVMCGLLAATFLADDELEEVDRILDRVAPAAARLQGTAPGLQADIDSRRMLNVMRRGGFEDALARLDLFEDYARRHGLGWYDGTQRLVRGWIAFERGDYPTAGALLRERIGDDPIYPALGALLSGEPGEAIALLGALDFSTETEGPVKQIEVELDPHLIASHAFELTDDRERAVVEAERELAIRRRYGPGFRLAQALRRRASLLPARRALALLEEAIVLADATPRRPVQVRIRASYGAALRRAGQVGAAREVLYEAVDGAAELGMERVRAGAMRELSSAGGRPRRARSTGPASLTEAQQQVAFLAASGLTNREIAERLFVTIKTVETHLVAVYRKLRVSGREELRERLAGATDLVGASGPATATP